jgi:hypothetical protein
MGEAGEIDKLRREVARLAAENDELRARFRVGPPTSQDLAEPKDEARGIAVLLAPDPAEERPPGSLSPQAVANLSRTIVQVDVCAGTGVSSDTRMSPAMIVVASSARCGPAAWSRA